MQLREMAQSGALSDITMCTSDYGRTWKTLKASGYWMQLLSSPPPQPIPMMQVPSVPQQPGYPAQAAVPVGVPMQPYPLSQPGYPLGQAAPMGVPMQPNLPPQPAYPQAQAAAPVGVPTQSSPLSQPDSDETLQDDNLDEWLDEEIPESEKEIGEVNVSLDEEDGNDPTSLLTCPHCWHVFHQSKLLYVSQHPELAGDTVLGPTAQTRFLPTVFNADGIPLDAMGLPCTDLACPKCHLQIPDAMIDHQNDLFSIVGCPSAGKSYYLTAMINQMRSSLLNFNYSITDADTTMNLVVSNYEQLLFQNGKQDEPVALPKTELQGNDFSSQVLLDGFTVNLPLPFVYTIRAMGQTGDELTERNLVFYDNAGEHFEPGRDQVANRATQHLVKSQCVIFLLDPFKDLRMRKVCGGDDPQEGKFCRDVNQMQILNEMIGRMRKNSGLARNQKYQHPLMLVLSKFDALVEQFPLDVREVDYILSSHGDILLNVSYVKLVSWMIRYWLLKHIPELIPTCEAFFERVYYLPASALGGSPQIDEQGILGIQPKDVHPFWCDVPLLIRMWENGLVPGCNVQVDPNSRAVDEYCTLQGEFLNYLPPGQKRTTVIPRLYWGAEVYDDQLGFIRFPNPNVPEAGNAPESTADKDDFWD